MVEYKVVGHTIQTHGGEIGKGPKQEGVQGIKILQYHKIILIKVTMRGAPILHHRVVK